MIQISHHLNGYTILNSLISIVVVSIFALAGIKNMTDISRQMLRNKIVLDDVMTEKNEEQKQFLRVYSDGIDLGNDYTIFFNGEYIKCSVHEFQISYITENAPYKRTKLCDGG